MIRMKSYFFIICNPARHAFYILTVFLLCSGCHPGYIVPARVEVFSQNRSEQLFVPGHLAVFPFYSTLVQNEMCRSVALKFCQEIGKKNIYTKITFLDNSPGTNRLDSRDLLRKEAVLRARDRHADLALIGFIESYMPGTATDTNISLSAMVVDVSQGDSLWWGADRLTGKPGNTFLLWDAALSPDAPSANKLLDRSVRRIVHKIYADYTRQKNTGLLNRVRNFLSSVHKDAGPAPEAPSDKSNDVLAPDNETLQEGLTTQNELDSKQILDSAIDDIETFDN